ncbi:hypothetical protein HanIR_Chr03g0128971 [Helianthus annuus]|nr:hypothetical protein HanIR_Chr03g0128971 [Helianthus annuus]
MSDTPSGSSQQIVIHKDVGSPTHCHYPILKPTNYMVWAIHIKTILEANGNYTRSKWTLEDDRTHRSNATGCEKKDKSMIAYLFQAIPEDMVLQVANCKTTKDIWNTLKTRHVGVDRVQKARLHTLMSEFELLQMKEDDTIDSFSARINNIVTRASEFGTTLNQPLWYENF